MTFSDSLIDKQKIRDQLGREDSPFIIFDQFSDTFVGEDLTLKITSNQIGTSFIVGNSPNATLGTTGVGLGADLSQTETVRRVVNPFNRFKEYVRGTGYLGTSTTATVDTDNYTITF